MFVERPIQTLAHIPDVTAFSDRIALSQSSGRDVSYSKLHEEVGDFCKNLRSAGIGTGDVVSIVLPNSIPYVVAFLGTTWARAVAAPLNSAYTEEEFAFYIEDAGAAVVLVPADLPETSHIYKAASRLNIPVFLVGETEGEVVLDTGGRRVKEAVMTAEEAQEEDVCLFLHTSGTTSRPKGVPLTHKNLSTSIKNIRRTYELTSTDCTLLVMPLFHVHGLMAGLLSSLHSGARVVIPAGGKFSAATFWKDITSYGCTWYTAVPTIQQILLMRAEQDYPKASPPSLRFIRSCSASLAPAVLEGLEKTFHAPVLEAYAMTEAAHQMTSNPLPRYGPHKPGSVGKGQNVKVAILDGECNILPPGTIGEVCIQGENVTKGYLNRPEANAEAFAGGWFHTGDQGFLDEEGYLTLTGRIKELINRGGEKISPLEVDAALLSLPEVGEAVAFAAPDEKYGEEVNAAVVLKPGAHATEEKLREDLKVKLSAFKLPKKLFIATDLPRTATGKIQRRFVAEHFLKGTKA